MAMENVHCHYTTRKGLVQVKTSEIVQQRRIEDKKHLYTGYVLLNEALNEFHKVYHKDNIIAHAVRVIGAIVDTMYEYTLTKKGA